MRRVPPLTGGLVSAFQLAGTAARSALRRAEGKGRNEKRGPIKNE